VNPTGKPGELETKPEVTGTAHERNALRAVFLGRAEADDEERVTAPSRQTAASPIRDLRAAGDDPEIQWSNRSLVKDGVLLRGDDLRRSLGNARRTLSSATAMLRPASTMPMRRECPGKGHSPECV